MSACILSWAPLSWGQPTRERTTLMPSEIHHTESLVSPARARTEMGERHLEAAADPQVLFVHGAGEAIGREPFRQRRGVDESAIDALGRRAQHAV